MANHSLFLVVELFEFGKPIHGDLGIIVEPVHCFNVICYLGLFHVFEQLWFFFVIICRFNLIFIQTYYHHKILKLELLDYNYQTRSQIVNIYKIIQIEEYNHNLDYNDY